MKKKKILCTLLVVLTLFILNSCGKENKSVTNLKEETQKIELLSIKDMAGRSIEVKQNIDSIYSTNPIGTTIIYTFDDTKLAGRNFDLSEKEKKYTTKHYQNIPNLGGWYGKGKTGNIEEIIKAKPDIIISVGTDATSVEKADALQKQLGIPVILIDDSFEMISKTYLFLGNLLHNESRGEELAKYCEETLNYAKEVAVSIPEENKIRVYYAEESAGLNTDPKGSTHTRLIEIGGGINVADVKMNSGYGRVQVSMEQVLTWNPDLIIACIDNGFDGSDSYNLILTDSSWAKIKAVQDKNVYQTPNIPFNWFDRPPSVNTIIGIKWVQYIMYPDKINYNIKEEAKKFYKLFYHIELTNEDIDYILEKAIRA